MTFSPFLSSSLPSAPLTGQSYPQKPKGREDRERQFHAVKSRTERSQGDVSESQQGNDMTSSGLPISPISTSTQMLKPET